MGLPIDNICLSILLIFDNFIPSFISKIIFYFISKICRLIHLSSFQYEFLSGKEGVGECMK